MVTGITAYNRRPHMNTIVYVGMDVHKESYTLCCYCYDTDKVEYKQTIPSDYKLVLKYMESVRNRYEGEVSFVCRYEAGCLGYSLYHQLREHEVDCKILAPTTMAITNTSRVKTDRRDAANIARCLAFHTYSEVYVPDAEDNSVKEYIRMRDDQKQMLKRTKQQILAFVLRAGKKFEGGKTYWTIAHIKWLKSLDLVGIEKETLTEYLVTYEYLTDKINRLDARIEEMASGDKYKDKVKNMQCLIGVKAHTALSMVVEIGDFSRFEKASKFAGFLGLVPSENSSGESTNRYSITKAGNSHLRRLMVEAAQCYTRGNVGFKSLALKQRQQGCAPEVIAYADKANERLRRRFYKMTLNKGMNRNVATTAIARELSCFIWGMATGNIN